MTFKLCWPIIQLANQFLKVNSKESYNFRKMKNVKNHSQFDDTDTFALLIKAASSEFEL